MINKEQRDNNIKEIESILISKIKEIEKNTDKFNSFSIGNISIIINGDTYFRINKDYDEYIEANELPLTDNIYFYDIQRIIESFNKFDVTVQNKRNEIEKFKNELKDNL